MADMGTDIQLHIELRIRGSEEWHHYAAPAVRRSYDFFALLGPCGRRNGEVEPVAPSRGLPDDASAITRLCHDARGGFGASWIGAREIDEVRKRWEHLEGRRYDYLNDDIEHGMLRTYLLGNALTSLDDTPFDDVRFVFWFD